MERTPVRAQGPYEETHLTGEVTVRTAGPHGTKDPTARKATRTATKHRRLDRTGGRPARETRDRIWAATSGIASPNPYSTGSEENTPSIPHVTRKWELPGWGQLPRYSGGGDLPGGGHIPPRMGCRELPIGLVLSGIRKEYI